MSGIIAVLNTNGEPLLPARVRRSTERMAFRGPDYLRSWVDGPIGLGHAAFHTTTEAALERQPLSLEGRIWLSAYARLDNREQLRNRLLSSGRSVPENVTDAALILHAYHSWQTDCPRYLMGDFVFVIWDAAAKRLFGARDHFGIRPLYYATTGSTLIVGNTLSAIRRFPEISQELDKLAVADFLLFGTFNELAMTAYASIRRLPPAHALTWTAGETTIARYWSLAREELLRYRRAGEYVAHFNELFTAAVSDRLRAARIAVTMSGGLDSTAVAAVAADQLRRNPQAGEIHAFSNSYQSLIPDDETHYARIAADYLDIPLQIRDVGHYARFDRWGLLDLRASEPADRSLAAWAYDQEEELASSARVILTGLGGDPLLYPEPAYLYALLGQRRLAELFFAVRLSWQTKKFPPLYLRTWLRWRLGKKDGAPPAPELPRWLDPAFVKAYKLADRWRAYQSAQPRTHPRRPQLVATLEDPFWPFFLESYDPENQFFPHEMRHPFFDLRLVQFMLRLPPVPWCVDKHLLRSAMRGYLPEEVLRRPKTPLAAFPRHPISAATGSAIIDHLSNSADRVREFGDLQVALDMVRKNDQENVAEYQASLRFIGLATWLDGNQR